MPISAKWKHESSIHIGFIVFNGGVTTFFAKSVYGLQRPRYRNRGLKSKSAWPTINHLHELSSIKFYRDDLTNDEAVCDSVPTLCVSEIKQNLYLMFLFRDKRNIKNNQRYIQFDLLTISSVVNW